MFNQKINILKKHNSHSLSASGIHFNKNLLFFKVRWSKSSFIPMSFIFSLCKTFIPQMLDKIYQAKVIESIWNRICSNYYNLYSWLCFWKILTRIFLLLNCQKIIKATQFDLSICWLYVRTCFRHSNHQYIFISTVRDPGNKLAKKRQSEHFDCQNFLRKEGDQICSLHWKNERMIEHRNSPYIHLIAHNNSQKSYNWNHNCPLHHAQKSQYVIEK